MDYSIRTQMSTNYIPLIFLNIQMFDYFTNNITFVASKETTKSLTEKKNK